MSAIGWRLENMWPLAWVLGSEPAPPPGGMITNEVIAALVIDMLELLDTDVALLKEAVRPRAEIVAAEDLFYCAHNAARSAQTGGATVSDGFHPVVGGGVMHERRMSLTWCISARFDWDDTDLSTSPRRGRVAGTLKR